MRRAGRRGNIPDHGYMSILELPVEFLWRSSGSELFVFQGAIGGVVEGGPCPEACFILLGGHLHEGIRIWDV